VTDVENDTERDIQASSIAYTIVRNTLYSEAYTAFFGSEDLTISGVHAFGPEGKTTYTTIADLAEANAKLLTDPRHRNKSYDLNANKSPSFARWPESSASPRQARSVRLEHAREGRRRYVSRGVPPEAMELHPGLLARRG
jgi:hypothetical protein